MSGIFNHPKMPLIAGGMTLALLGGGMYLSVQEEQTPVTVARVQAPLASPARKAPIQAAVTPAPKAQDLPLPDAASGAPASANISQTDAAAPAAPSAALPKPSEASPTPGSALMASNVQGSGSVNNVAVANTPTSRVAPPQAITPSVPVAIAAEAKLESAVSPTIAPINTVAPRKLPVKPKPIKRVAAPKLPAVVEAPAVTAEIRKEPVHAEVLRQQALTLAALQSKATQNTQRNAAVPENKTSDYTEIHAATSTPNLTAPTKQGAEAVSGPSLLTTSGGKAWIRVSATRTVVVKVGDEVPGMGKVLTVTSADVVTEKGKLLIAKE